MRKNTIYIIGTILLIASIALITAGTLIHKSYVSAAGIAGALLAVVLVASASGYKRIWKCEKCGTVTEIGLKQYYVSPTGRQNVKRLHCTKCNKKTWFKGIEK